MHDLNNLGSRKIIGFGDGSVFITETVLFAIIVAVVLIILALFLTRKMQQVPGKSQAIAEIIVETIYNMVGNNMGKHNLRFAPYIGTLMIFLIFCNATGLFGVRPVTADVNMTFGMSTITFFIIQVSSIKANGLGGYFHHLCKPMAFMLPLNILEQISLVLSLGFRLFGNIAGGMVIMAMIFSGLHAGCEALHLPIPILQAVIPLPANLFFDVFEPVLQAFIFTMLTMIFISKELPAPGEEH
ncbi:MAG: F0F1 ATP synthase subunit A [Firmicutes bacterium]|nr:F0F1 ATP synthase subunit A [Bacillota bacterium]